MINHEWAKKSYEILLKEKNVNYTCESYLEHSISPKELNLFKK